MERGFTIIELIVVIAIISLLSSIVLVDVSWAIKKARDAKRLVDIKNISKALEMYRGDYGRYPANTDSDYGGWDTGYNGGESSGDPFINPLKPTYMSKVPGDPITTEYNSGYAYYLYGAGSYGCDSTKGDFYVLGVRNMETITGTYPGSPGWLCSSRNWQNEFEWVTGNFTK